MRMKKDAIYIDTPVPVKRPDAKRSRAIPVRGQPVEEYQYERLIKCWYCGDINTTGRDEGKSSNTTMSTVYSMPRELSRGSGGRTPEEVISVNKTIFSHRVMPIAGADGNARPVKNVFTIDSYLGCKGCGTLLEDT